MDGANWFVTMWKIYLPLSKPSLATVSLFVIVNHWNAWFDGMIYITTPSRVPMQTYLRSILIDMNVAMGDLVGLVKTQGQAYLAKHAHHH